jgi:signal transduction histidine kinase
MTALGAERKHVHPIDRHPLTVRERSFVLRPSDGKVCPNPAIAQHLNSMLDRIGELVEANRQVSDNVAHDLRTQLTRVRGRLEQADNQHYDPDRYRALLATTIGELDEILRIFSSLLRIARIEAQAQRAAFHRINLSELAREVVDLFEPTAEQNRMTLRMGKTEPIAIRGDRDLLFDALSNLLDNAIKHGSSGGAVTVEVQRTAAGGPILVVADRGPGIPWDEKKNVIKRFYRLERSRQRPGSGLGLSLVEAVAQLHDTRIELLDNNPGLKVELHFPSAATTRSVADLHDLSPAAVRR